MNKKLKIIGISLILGILVVLVSSYIVFKYHVFEVVVERDEIKMMVDAKLPFRKTYYFVFELLVNKADVILTDGSERVGIDSKIELNVVIGKEREPLGCSVLGSGKIRYDQNEGVFFLDDLRVDHLNMQGIPDKYSTKISVISTALLKDHYSRHPIYRLDNGQLKNKLAKAILKDVKILNGRIHIYLGY